MDPNTILDLFQGLDLRVMGSLAVIAAVLRMVPAWPAWVCIAVPAAIAAVFGYLVTPEGSAPAQYLSAVLFNSAGAVVVGRMLGPKIGTQLGFNDPKDAPPPPLA